MRVDSRASHRSTQREGVVGNGERIAVPPVAELELALEVGTAQVIGRRALGERRAVGAVARPAGALDQAVDYASANQAEA
jgi:hypothetical protein